MKKILLDSGGKKLEGMMNMLGGDAGHVAGFIAIVAGHRAERDLSLVS